MNSTLAEICRRYREEALAREARVTRFWNGENLGRHPVTIVPWQYSPRQIYNNPDLQMERMARYIERSLTVPGEHVPIFWPDQGTIVLASVFGGRVVSEGTAGSHQWIDPVLKSWEDVDRLEPPNLMSGLVKTEFDLCRRFYEESGGLGWVAPPDMQGPVNMACFLMDSSEFLMGLYTEPERARKLLRLCTDVILGVVEMYRREFGSAFRPLTWPHIWLPENRGGTVTQDSIPTLSPELYREFEAPLLQEIADSLNGVFVHCCGAFEYALPVLREIRGLMGLDHAYPESHAEKIFEVLGTGICLVSNVTTRGEEQFPTRDRYLEYLLPRLPDDARLWVVLTDDQPAVTLRALELLGAHELREAYQRTLPADGSR